MAKPAAYRRHFLLPSLLLLTACTLDIARTPPDTAEAESSTWAIRFQRQSSLLTNTLVEIDETELQAGDLLFSSSVGIASLGIRAFSASSVSHVAVYLGDEEVAEATGAGVQIVSLRQAMQHSDKLFALRVPDLTSQQAAEIKAFAYRITNSRYNFRGIVKFIPFMLTKQICSLNPFSANFRQQCIHGLAQAQLSKREGDEKRVWFCSEFVTDAFAKAGRPLTLAEPGWIAPSDLLHMREGDVAAFKPEARLRYVGHLKPGIYINARRLVGLTQQGQPESARSPGRISGGPGS
ncbi:YaeF family permuted papain-like enzyme [Intestinirhabdus alba]|jgi:hypothetical protein|uniref:YaeF family permuted papain-like enzyme n=1 Tax=Intestinirhabdus alba TaxID=2899544 RepID=A0A6L6IHY1_9ENTR|nr:YaeF family permuted papain-like enzyme [Intestinirhabdus alba]MTH45206.1 YaeF family permuted papain-like enzyme [Intestinirhabdus alba]